MEEVILTARDLTKYFFRRKANLLHGAVTIKALDGVDIEVRRGEVFAVIGESGCGKSTLGNTLTRIYKPTRGEIWFDGQEISAFGKAELKEVGKKMPMVFQDAGTSLNPKHSIEYIISLPLKIHYHLTRAELKERVARLLDLVNLPADMMGRYPPSLSGGEKQRVGIARALALDPKVVVLDEPTSALDVSVQAKILNLLEELQQRLHLTYILITHNLSLTKHLADRVAVMYLGKIIETAETQAIFKKPTHPYTKALLSAIPVVQESEKELIPAEVILEGELPSPANPPKHCHFYSRCQEREESCRTRPIPELEELEPGHLVRCHVVQRKGKPGPAGPAREDL